jgi:peptidoglycan hydrolase-like protein with peptidoglycan-binding domain
VRSSKATPAGTAARTKAAGTKTGAKPASVAKTKGKKVVPRSRAQQAPTTDRYKEIQQALISKGYLQGEATGQWGPDCVDALKRFQSEQNLTPDGKIGSLSLIALGLGPKRLTAQTAPAAAPATTSPVSPAPEPVPAAPSDAAREARP